MNDCTAAQGERHDATDPVRRVPQLRGACALHAEAQRDHGQRGHRHQQPGGLPLLTETPRRQ